MKEVDVPRNLIWLVKSLYNYQEASARIIHEFVSGIFSMFISIQFIHGVVLRKRR